MYRDNLVLDATNVDDNLWEVPLVVHNDFHTRLHHLHGAVKRSGALELPALER